MFDRLLRIVWRFRRGNTPAENQELRFARTVQNACGRSLDEWLSFWAGESLYQDIRRMADGEDAAPFMRASIRLGLGIFAECPELVKHLDQRYGKDHSMSLLVTSDMSERLLMASGGRKSPMVRASIELGLLYFAVHPEHIRILDRK
jgi:hypothetical protein